MKRTFDQVDVSSDESSSSNDHKAENEQISSKISSSNDHKAENEQMSSKITVVQVVDELVSEGTKFESKQMSDSFNIGQGVEELFSEDVIFRKARMYQEYMQMVPLPTVMHSLFPCNSWRELAASIKTLYGQPLHYLTNLRLNEWDKMRIEADNEDDPLDVLIHPTKAESCIWLMEEVHRRTSSPSYIAKLWVADPMYHVYIDAIFPKLQNPSK